MEVTNDLLRCEECVVANVVNCDADADRSPACAIKAEFAGGAPGFGFESLGRFAKQRLLWRVDDPGAAAGEGDGVEGLVADHPGHGVGQLDFTARALFLVFQRAHRMEAVVPAHRRGIELHAWFNPFRARAPRR